MSGQGKTPLEALIEIEKDVRKFGFNWNNYEMILEQVISECEEIQEAIIKQESKNRIQEEIGDLIHTAISLCIYSGYDVNQTLAKTTEKFANRIARLKEFTKQQGLKDLKGQSPDFMLELWHKVKNSLKDHS